jgi:hypothetical protein
LNALGSGNGPASTAGFASFEEATFAKLPPAAAVVPPPSSAAAPQDEDDLFALPMSPRSPEMAKSPFSFAASDTGRYLQEGKAA